MFDKIRRWWNQLWRRITTRQESQLSFRVSGEEKILVEFWAERYGTTVSEFLRDAVTKAIPIEERKKFESRWVVGEALDFVDQVADSEDGLLLPPGLPEPEPDPSDQPLHLPRNHNCAYLDDTAFPRFFSGSMCYGTCDHRAQRGRPCFWPTQTAHHCDYYRPAKLPNRS